MKFIFTCLCSLLLFLFSCSSTKILQAPIIEEEMLDTMVITAPKPVNLKTADDFKLKPYAPSAKRNNDLIHTKLELNFDWEKQHVIGKATLTLKPWFYPTKKLVLDAKGFDIRSITFANQNTQLKYEYDEKQITIDLGKEFTREQEYQIYIDYTAKPVEATTGGGSAAITSEQGLFFINHDGSDPNKPQQIWTQGETEFNSVWFPTIDKPNERCTQEMYMTVQDKFKTLSNGLLISSTKNNNGTRTDYWKMDIPHAPYLFMVAVGDFAVVNDKWEGIDVDYYVEPEYKEYARDIFPYTPEMLSFFSEITGVKYPWQKYAQVVVRDYVSGAMENTTAVIFGDFVQKSKRELIDVQTNEKIVAHELFHHWFGDYVTCESWANLTLNEGFANYSEYLWIEFKHGEDAGGAVRYEELQGYLQSTGYGGIHPLIHYGYKDKEDMFDAHSYNKGGLILNMLRSYLGDEAFFATLKKYLSENALTDVEADELRIAFEDISGEDLNWFFDQWFHSAGHPELDIKYDFNQAAGRVDVTIEQKQNPEQMPAIFILPLAIDIYEEVGKVRREQVQVNERKQVFSFDVSAKPKLIKVDAQNILLGTKTDNKSIKEYAFQYKNGPMYLDRKEALDAIAESGDKDYLPIFSEALNDKYWGLRKAAIQVLMSAGSTADIPTVAALAKKDPHSAVRAIACVYLGSSKDVQYATLLKEVIAKDQSYPVISSALSALADIDSEEAMKYAAQMENENNANLLLAVGKVYGKLKDPSKIKFFESNWSKIEQFDAFGFFDDYSKSLKAADNKTIDESTTKMKELATNKEQSIWKRFCGTRVLHELRIHFSDKGDKTRVEALNKAITDIKAWEKDSQLTQVYSQF